MSWEPILDGELAERATTVLHVIADGLADETAPSPHLVLFWSYVSNLFDDERTANRTSTAFERFASDIERQRFRGIHLYVGLTGAGWAAAHVADDAEGFLEVVDANILDALSAERWVGNYDLISGLVGHAVYFLERGVAPSATIGLTRIVEHLITTCERIDLGARWHSPPEFLPEDQLELSPQGYYHCGLAHGIAGVVAVLAKISDRGDVPGAAKIRDEAARWLEAQRLPGRGFPMAFSSQNGPLASRTAWCMGDPGVALALAHTGRAPLAGLDAWMQRTVKESGVSDAGLCHGSAGLAHLCNRFYQSTGVPAYREAARTWFQRTLEMQRHGVGIGGVSMANSAERRSVRTASLLEGTVGIGLALLSALTPIEPSWDRMLLCDLPVRRKGSNNDLVNW